MGHSKQSSRWFLFFFLIYSYKNNNYVFGKYVFLFSALVEIVLYFGCPTRNSNLEFTIGELCIVVKEQFLHSTWLNGTFDLSTVHNNFSFLTNGLVFRELFLNSIRILVNTSTHFSIPSKFLMDFCPCLSNGPNQKINKFIFLMPILKTRAKILQKFGSFFGRFEDTKIPFWD